MASSFSSNGLKFPSSHFLIKSLTGPFVTHNKCFNKLAWRAGIKYGHNVNSKEKIQKYVFVYFHIRWIVWNSNELVQLVKFISYIRKQWSEHAKTILSEVVQSPSFTWIVSRGYFNVLIRSLYVGNHRKRILSNEINLHLGYPRYQHHH